MLARFESLAFIIIAAIAWSTLGNAQTVAERASQALLTTNTVVSMDFQDALLGQVLKVLSAQTKLNFVASDSVKDKAVTLYLDRVTVQEALDTILKATGLTYEVAPGNVFIVKESGAPAVRTEQRIFRLKYASAGGRKNSPAKEQKTDTVSTSASSSGPTGSYSSSSSDKGGSTDSDVEETSVQDLIRPLMSKEYGKVVVDNRTNSLIAIDIPAYLDIVEKVIQEIDIKSPQVLIEVEILDTALNKIEDIGVTWGTGTNNARIAVIEGPAKQISFPFRGEFIGVPSFPLGPAGTGVSPPGIITTAPTGLTSGAISLNSLQIALDLIEQDSRTKVLGKPKIMTLNNIPARIDVTKNEAIASVTTIASASSGLSTSASSQAERVLTGVRLRVTPQINEDDYVTMVVEPQVIDTTTSTFSSSFRDPRTRSVKTTVMLKDGDTLVIGGLVSTNETLLVRKIPILGDLPFGAGTLFRNKENDHEDRELLVFLTPHIVREESFPLRGSQPLAIEEAPLPGGLATVPAPVRPVPQTVSIPAGKPSSNLKAAQKIKSPVKKASLPSLDREQEGLSREDAIEQAIQGLR